MSNLITQAKRSVEKSFSSLINAKLSYLRIAPRKVRMVVDLVRGKSVDEAQIILNFTIKRATHPLLKLLKQGIANAKDVFQAEQSDLYISEIRVDEGPKLKRWRARARGRAFEIKKRTSHISLSLSAIEGEKGKKEKKKGSALVKTTANKKERQIEKIIKEKPKFKPTLDIKKPQSDKESMKKIFRRKAF